LKHHLLKVICGSAQVEANANMEKSNIEKSTLEKSTMDKSNMEKSSTVAHHEQVGLDEHRQGVSEFKGAAADNATEHQLTLGQVWKHHRGLVGWSLFWSMCAIGW
jgi:hypothetical protein